MRRLWQFSVFIRFVLWAGIVFLGGIAYAQGKNIDTLHILKVHIDTLRLGFEDVLQFSVQYDSADKDDWRYLYRWNTGERTDGIQVKFEGKRKVLYVGQRFSAIHWPEEYDTFFAAREPIWYAPDPEEDTCIVCAPTIEADTVQYVWQTISGSESTGVYHVAGRGRCIYACPTMFSVHPEWVLRPRPTRFFLYCSPKVVSLDETQILFTSPSLKLEFDTISGIKQRMQGTAQRHDLNVWDRPP